MKSFFLIICFLGSMQLICCGNGSPSWRSKKHWPLILVKKGDRYVLPETYYGLKYATNNEEDPPTFFCPPESSDFIRNIDEYCLVPTENENNYCKTPLNPLIIKSQQLVIPCGIDGESVYYDFVYRICYPDGKNKHEKSTPSIKVEDHLVYRICYNQKKKETEFVYYQAMPITLLDSPYLAEDRDKTYKIETDGFELWRNNFSALSESYNKFRITPLESIMLAWPDHLPLAGWKKPIYHRINTKPAYQNVASEWEKLNKTIQAFSIEKKKNFITIGGAYGELKIKGEIQYFDKDNGIAMPEYFWKIIVHPDTMEIASFVLHNVTDSKYIVDKLCDNLLGGSFSDIIYSCGKVDITKLFNLPQDLLILQSSGNFIPLVMSFFSGEYQFPRSYNGLQIPDDSEKPQILFCPTRHDLLQRINCLLPNENPNPYCLSPITPSFVNPSNNCGGSQFNGIRTGHRDFIYRVCNTNEKNIVFPLTESQITDIISNSFEFTVYRVCYNFESEMLIYTQHKISSPALLRNNNLKQERELKFRYIKGHYQVLDDISAETLNTSDKRNIRTLTDLKEKQTLIKLNLISPEDFTFAGWKKPAYNEINTIPTWQNIRQIWDLLNEYIRLQAIDKNEELVQINGLTDELIIGGIKTVFYEGQKIINLPKYLWKVIYNAEMTKSIAIVINNVPDQKFISDGLCEPIPCTIQNWFYKFPSTLEQFVICCNSQVFTKLYDLPEAQDLITMKEYSAPLVLNYYQNQLKLPEEFQGYGKLSSYQSVFCPAENEITDSSSIDGHCLVPHESGIPYCSKPIEPILIKSDSTERCGNDDSTYYNFVFPVCIKTKDQKLIRNDIMTYFVCINLEKSEPIYTRHTISSPNLLDNEFVKNEMQINFKFGTNKYNLGENFDFQYLTSAYAKFENNNDIQHPIKPLMLVSPYDLGFTALKKSAYHYINTKPAYKNVIQIWNVVNNHIQTEFSKKKKNLIQINGWLDDLIEDGKKIHLDEESIVLPKYFWKLLYNEEMTESIAIIVHNTKSYNVTEKLCKKNLCEIQSAPLNFVSDIVYCCEPNIISKHFKSLISTHNVMNLDNNRWIP